MDINERNFYYDMFIEKWGVDSQLNMAIEEMSELTKALCKFFRGEEDIDNIHEEIIDVEIMIEQLKRIFKIGEEWTNTQKDFKINKASKLVVS